jgi:rubrerythrin
MAGIFNANEVFEMAKQIEINGAAFYRKAAENNDQGRNMLLDLAAQEDEHLATFKALQDELSPREAESAAFDPDNEGLLYLKAMADAKVFDVRKSPASILRGNESLDQIIKIAIGLEKDSIVFYLGIKEMVPRKLGEDRIMDIVKEEMKHIRRLSSKLSK